MAISKIEPELREEKDRTKWDDNNSPLKFGFVHITCPAVKWEGCIKILRGIEQEYDIIFNLMISLLYKSNLNLALALFKTAPVVQSYGRRRTFLALSFSQ